MKKNAEQYERIADRNEKRNVRNDGPMDMQNKSLELIMALTEHMEDMESSQE